VLILAHSLLRLNYYVMNHSTSLKISLPYQAVYQYLLDNPVSGPSFIPVKTTGHKTPGESSDNITVSSYDTTHF